MNAHIKCGPGHIDLSRYSKNDKQQGGARLTSAEIHALESFFYGLNGQAPTSSNHLIEMQYNLTVAIMFLVGVLINNGSFPVLSKLADVLHM
jgi:hypothetical protein